MCNVVIFLLGSALQTGATSPGEAYALQSLVSVHSLHFPSRLPLWWSRRCGSGSGCPDACRPHVPGRDFQCKCSRIFGRPATTLHYDWCKSGNHSSFVCMNVELSASRSSSAVGLSEVLQAWTKPHECPYRLARVWDIAYRWNPLCTRDSIHRTAFERKPHVRSVYRRSGRRLHWSNAGIMEDSHRFPDVPRPGRSMSRFSGVLIVIDVILNSAWASGWHSCPIHHVG
jgi:hypothetical protein